MTDSHTMLMVMGTAAQVAAAAPGAARPRLARGPSSRWQRAAMAGGEPSGGGIGDCLQKCWGLANKQQYEACRQSCFCAAYPSTCVVLGLPPSGGPSEPWPAPLPRPEGAATPDPRPVPPLHEACCFQPDPGAGFGGGGTLECTSGHPADGWAWPVEGSGGFQRCRPKASLYGVPVRPNPGLASPVEVPLQLGRNPSVGVEAAQGRVPRRPNAALTAARRGRSPAGLPVGAVPKGDRALECLGSDSLDCFSWYDPSGNKQYWCHCIGCGSLQGASDPGDCITYEPIDTDEPAKPVPRGLRAANPVPGAGSLAVPGAPGVTCLEDDYLGCQEFDDGTYGCWCYRCGDTSKGIQCISYVPLPEDPAPAGRPGIGGLRARPGRRSRRRQSFQLGRQSNPAPPMGLVARTPGERKGFSCPGVDPGSSIPGVDKLVCVPVGEGTGQYCYCQEGERNCPSALWTECFTYPPTVTPGLPPGQQLSAGTGAQPSRPATACVQTNCAGLANKAAYDKCVADCFGATIVQPGGAPRPAAGPCNADQLGQSCKSMFGKPGVWKNVCSGLTPCRCVCLMAGGQIAAAGGVRPSRPTPPRKKKRKRGVLAALRRMF